MGYSYLFWAGGIYRVFITSGWSLRGIYGYICDAGTWHWHGHQGLTVRVRHKDDPSHYLIQNSRSLFKQESTLLTKSLFPKFCGGSSLLTGCIYNQGIVNKIIPSFEDPSNATQMCCISCILLQSLLYGVLWRIQWRQRVLLSPMCYK